ncbi:MULTISPECIES: DUF5684 domain-containing protein [Microbacterium]|uniref:DUF805 domain-containing protein n=1 Tax=Microbacterium laevaniformans TaxID=36807 RepID=A0A150H663_9MICO|nr:MULTISPECIES: DUF5684 domain-containing protein [Microbacterium]EXJ51649.1 hypothetical protein AS96_08535 [Microbacterium sp. MRS-1]KXZ57504.1 hypothetical protein Mlaev_02691 [Microbacterium laevaniformans]
MNNTGTLNRWQAAFGGGTGFVLFVAYYVLLAVAMWKVFSKAGYPGILALIPIVAIRIGRGFGHGAFFSIVLLLLFAPIGFFIIGFSSDRYTSPA